MVSIMLNGQTNFCSHQTSKYCKKYRDSKILTTKKGHVIRKYEAKNDQEGFNEHVWMHPWVDLQSNENTRLSPDPILMWLCYTVEILRVTITKSVSQHTIHVRNMKNQAYKVRVNEHL